MAPLRGARETKPNTISLKTDSHAGEFGNLRLRRCLTPGIRALCPVSNPSDEVYESTLARSRQLIVGERDDYGLRALTDILQK